MSHPSTPRVAALRATLRTNGRWARPIVVAVALAMAVVAAACAHDVSTRFPQPAGAEPTTEVGAIELAFAAPASSVSVACNGVMVVRDVRTERITIAGVPTGYADLAIAAGPGEKQLRVWVEAGRTTSVPLGAPDDAPLTTVRSIALSLLSLAIYTLLR